MFIECEKERTKHLTIAMLRSAGGQQCEIGLPLNLWGRKVNGLS